MKIDITKNMRYVGISIAFVIAYANLCPAFPFIYDNVSVISGTISLSDTTIRKGYNPGAMSSWPPWYSTWIIYESEDITKYYKSTINFDNNIATRCTIWKETSNGFDILSNCEFHTIPDTVSTDYNYCIDYTNYMSSNLVISSGSYSGQTSKAFDAPGDDFCTLPPASSTTDQSVTRDSSHKIKFDKCSANQKIKQIKVYGSFNTVSSTNSEIYSYLLINGISPTITNNGRQCYNCEVGYPNSYTSGANAEWVIPVNASCNDTFPINISGSSGLFYGSIIKIDVTYNVCDLKIDTLIGKDKVLNPTSGGSVGINGSISDSSGQPISWTLNILDQTFSGSGNLVNATWDGKYADGTVVEEGEYTATLTAKTADGKCIDTKTVNFSVTEAEDDQCGLYVQFGSSAHIASGNLSHSQELFSSRGGALPVGMTLYYNSLDHRNGSLGRGWSHSYDVSLKENSDGSVLISEGNWRHKYYKFSNGIYTGQLGNYAALAKNPDGSFTLAHKDGQTYSFNADGTLASISDRNGNVLSLAYNGVNLATVTDPSGRTIAFAYDEYNHLASITDSSGNAYTFSVGSGLSSVIQPDGGTWQYGYDDNSFILSKTDPLGNVTSYSYDDQHRVIASIDPEGRARNIAYPQSSDTVKTTTFTEKGGGEWSYSYDTQKGYLLSKTDPQGGTTSYGYDANGNRTSTTNPDGTNTSATYDSTGNMLTSTDALGQITGYTYNSFGQVTGITDAQGGVTAYAYDVKGNMTALTDPAGGATKYEYDTKGNVSKVTDPAGQTTGFTYDQKGNLATVTDATGATSSYVYDNAGNVISITDANGTVTRFIYDSRNRLIKSIDPNGNATIYTYDANGNKLSDTDANGNITKYEYNSHNQLIKTTDALGNATTYSYGGSSCPSCGGGSGEKLTALTDANGNVTSYSYDQLGRLVKESDPKGNEASYAYDSKGNLITKTDANGNTVTYSYDANGRLLKKAYPDSTEETFSYDPKGNILTATNKDISYNFGYDAVGRMQSSTDSNGKVLQYSYDNTGRKTKTIYPEGSVVSYAYDSAGRLAKITNGGGRTYSYSYDKLGRRTKNTYPTGATANYGYDMTGRLTNLDHKQSTGKIIASFAYVHDKVGNRLTKTEPDSKTNYAYDAIYRLLKAQPNRHGGTSETYDYDPVGNRLNGPERHIAYTYGTNNELLKREHTKFTYDKNGNMVANGQHRHGDEHHGRDNDLHDGKRWAYTYDFENRLIKAEKKQGHEATIVTFKYDPFGRRIEKRINEGENCRDEDVVVHTYVYDGQAIILENEVSGEGRHKRTETTKYVHGPGIDEPLAMTRGNEVYYYHADGLGSVVVLTDKKQKIVENYEYNPFGNLKGDTKPTQPFTYTSREWDKETGLYYYRARYYDPMVGRFISKDPIGFRGGTNIYAYVQNNPVNWIDPTGLLCTYSQSAGQLTCTNDCTGDQYLTCTGYAGNGDGLNNSDAQDQENVGPLPQGDYTVGAATRRRGPQTRPLTPDSNNEMYGRAGFLIHGDNAAQNHTASQGCIIVPRNCRERIPTGETLRVVP